MMLRAGKLDRRVEIMRAGAGVHDGFTKKPGALEVFATRWASWQPSRGNRVFENAGREAKAGGTFWLRYDSKTRMIVETDLVRDENGRDWTILSIQEVGRREGLEITVTADD